MTTVTDRPHVCDWSLATSMAHDDNGDVVTTGHVLLACLLDADNVIHQAFHARGVAIGRPYDIQRWIVHLIELERTPDDDDPTLSQTCATALRLAEQRARDRDYPAVTAAHLLYGLLEAPASIASRLISMLGVTTRDDLDRLINTVGGMLGTGKIRPRAGMATGRKQRRGRSDRST